MVIKKILNKIEKRAMPILEKIHLKIFGHPMSDTMRNFLGNLSWSAIGGIGAAGIMFVVQILVARWLGPVELGKYNVILSFATVLSFLFLLGNDVGIVRFLSDTANQKRSKYLFGAASLLVGIQVFVVLIILVVAWLFFKKYIHLDIAVYSIGIIFGLIIAVKSLVEAYIKSKLLLKKQAVAKIVEASIVLVILLFFYMFAGVLQFYHYTSIVIFSYIVFIIILCSDLLKQLRWPSLKDIRALFNYNKFVILIGFGGMLMSADKMLIGKFIGLEQLGVYSMYYLTSSLVLASIGGIFMNAFLPSVVMEKRNIKMVIKKINIIFLKGFFVWLVGSVIIMYGSFAFVGGEYQFIFLLGVLFVIMSYFAFIFSTMISILNIDRIKVSVVINLAVNVISICSIIMFKSIMIYVSIQLFLYIIAFFIINIILNRYYAYNKNY